MQLLDYGARIVSIMMPDRKGHYGDVVVGFGDIENFEKKDRFIGPVIGRFGNRINHAAFTLDGIRYELVANEELGGEPVQCHGGTMGFDRFIWDATPVKEEGRTGVRFHRVSPDGEQGFPGTMDVNVTYWLTDNNTVRVEYEATTDKPTVVNLSNHTYFNLTGDSSRDICSHVAKFNSSHVLGVDEGLIPDGSLVDVSKTPFDFRSGKAIGSNIDDPCLSRTGGYDHAFVIDRFGRDCDVHRGFTQFAHIYEPSSGRMMQAFTDLPAFHFYTGNFLNGIEGYGNRCGFCLETEFFPDCVNHSDFPSCIIKAGDLFESTTAFHFYTDLSNAGSCVKMCADAASKEA